uniref:Uncharacterized protein n=1 Tax=Glossina pallidipes TaxID=7398 RepID=A0A1A9ZEZ7_GLOPL
MKGPTTVQMVSQNRAPPPPMPVPVQVSQGQVMQQYVNENGTLTHVVLSPQQYQQLHAGQGHIPPPFVSQPYITLQSYNKLYIYFYHIQRKSTRNVPVNETVIECSAIIY